ncbi:hypothetical protein GCM10029976_095530 [Kribbella albertanoniae]|uniref:Uncharacterized protein n=1 Tax=Kribbella albertanoniae TaxID=1266829 RepID=A0A4R4PU66_9ACTN|nr:hypothetical protein [Kribbella albertanoniae]TDC25918.1 hypothetical protein E1261_23320 [Kribbella albertanoniae]
MDVTRSQLLRSLVILGALVGLFALHGGAGQPDRPERFAVTPVMITLPLDAHGAMERLEQVAMAAPLTLAVDSSNHQHLLVPCALLIGSVLLLGLGLLLTRQRFGEVPLRSLARQVRWLRAVVPDPPDLTRLCVLRT